MKPDVLRKHRCNAFGTGPQECIVSPERNDGLKPTVEDSTVHFKAEENRQTQV